MSLPGEQPSKPNSTPSPISHRGYCDFARSRHHAPDHGCCYFGVTASSLANYWMHAGRRGLERAPKLMLC